MTSTLLVASADGLRQLQLDSQAGTATPVGGVISVQRPLALTTDPSQPGLAWAVACTPDGSAFPLQTGADGPSLGEVASSGGAVPCHTGIVSGEGPTRTVAVANYTGHTVGFATFNGLPAGTVTAQGPVVDFGEGSHPHQVLPSGGQLIVSDLGLDSLHVLDSADPQAPAIRIELEPGAGPRNAVPIGDSHLAVALEVANAAALVRIDRDADGRITGGRQVARVGFEGDPDQTHPSQILRDSRGFVHVLNRGSQRLCTLTVEGDNLELVTERTVPDFPMDIIELDGLLLIACRDGDTVVALQVADPDTEVFRIEVPSPNAIAVV